MLWFKTRNQNWTISRLQSLMTAHGQRVSADVGGRPIWFESADINLTPAPEAFAQAMLIPALHQRRRLEIHAPLDGVWLDNIRTLTKVFSSWWNYPTEVPIDGALAACVDEPKAGLAGLCFSCGIDSFSLLLQGSTPVDSLIFVHGFDVRLKDSARMDAMSSSLRHIAAATGKRLVTVRTNIREHPYFRSVPWERTHGAALAAIGHLLAPELEQLLIAATFATSEYIHWGSHWHIDHLWSASRTRIVGELTPHTRWDKLAALGGHPLIQQHLRVCWKNLTPTGNCSRCEKCLRTMIMLDMNNHLRASRVFNQTRPLADLLDAVPKAPPHTHLQWRQLAELNAGVDQKHAIKRLLARSPAVSPSLGVSAEVLLASSTAQHSTVSA